MEECLSVKGTKGNGNGHATPRSGAPEDFWSALRDGWEIVGETSKLTADHKHRHGRLILKKDRRLVRIRYTASLKTGFRFGKPEWIEH